MFQIEDLENFEFKELERVLTEKANNKILILTFSKNERTTSRPINTNEGGSRKQYIKLQKGGKRLVRYGKRGGRYYMKCGKKHYIK